MSDLKLAVATDLSSVDLVFNEAGDDLVTGHDLETSVYTSLHSDRADPNVLVGDRRGWCLDAFRDEPIGSRLWTLARAKRTTATLRRAEDYAREALAWLIRRGIAETITVRASWLNGSILFLDLDIVQAGRGKLNLSYTWAWN